MMAPALLPGQLPPVGALLKLLETRLAAAGILEPACEAALLLSELLSCRQNDLFLKRGVALSPTDEARLRDWFRRRVEERVPLQYLFGRAAFYNLELTVTPAVLIPRPETELLVDFLIQNLPPHGRLLDLGTGSGAISLALLSERSDATALGVDASEAALAVAQRNAADLQLTERITFLLSDLCSALPAEVRFDAVAANLPYVTEEEYLTLDPEVRRHEPKLALTAAEQGLALIFRSAAELPSHLVPGGTAIWELSPFQAPLLTDLLQHSGGWHRIRVLRDLTGRDRFVAAECGGEGKPF